MVSFVVPILACRFWKKYCGFLAAVFLQYDFFENIYANWNRAVDADMIVGNREEKRMNGKVKNARLLNINLDKIRIICNFYSNTCRTEFSKMK